MRQVQIGRVVSDATFACLKRRLFHLHAQNASGAQFFAIGLTRVSAPIGNQVIGEFVQCRDFVIAIAARQDRVTKRLLELGADPNLRLQDPPSKAFLGYFEGDAKTTYYLKRDRNLTYLMLAALTEQQSTVGDLIAHGDRLMVAVGGEGGKGNTRFKSSTNRAPRQSTPGTPGPRSEAT